MFIDFQQPQAHSKAIIFKAMPLLIENQDESNANMQAYRIR